MKVYIAASYRHLHAVRLFHLAVADAAPGIRILDWTGLATPPDGLNPAQRREWMDTDHGGEVFSFCAAACGMADLVVYFGQSGQDAGVEVGLAAASGIPLLGIRGPLESPGLMLHGAVTRWCADAETAVRLVARLATCRWDNVDSEDCLRCDCADLCSYPQPKVCPEKEVSHDRQ